MNPPRDAGADGSPSNCCAFFHQCGTRPLPASNPHSRFSTITQQKFISATSLTLSSLPVQLSLARPPPPFLPPRHSSLLLPLYFYFVSASLCSCSHPPPPNLFPWLVLSLVQMCPWSAVAWLGDNRSDFETGGWQPCCH